jgi:ribosomal protein S18 acetylase RimI-like enzyme
MSLVIRLAKSSDYKRLEQLIIESFEPITMFRKVDEHYGPLKGKDWRDRWRVRLRKVFDTQHILVGELEGDIVACASGTVDSETGLAFLDLLGVDGRFQGRGFGRDMLTTFMSYMKEQGAEHLHLDCLADNHKGNKLYGSEGFEQLGGSVHWYIKLPESLSE